MRIAYICGDLGVPIFGQKGCSVHVQEMLRTMLRAGATVDVFAARFGPAPPTDLAALRLHLLDQAGENLDLNGPKLKAEESWNMMLDEALRHAHALGEPAAGRRPFDLVYERYSLWSCAGMEFARRNRISAILEVNAPLIEEQAQHRTGLNRAAAEKVARRVFTGAHSLIAVSAEVATYLANFLDSPKQIEVVPNGVDPSRFPDDLQPAWRHSAAELVVGFVGSLKPWHGLEVLAEGFARFHQIWPGARLLVVGDGPGKARLLEELERAGAAAAAHMTGAVSPERVPSLIASMDVTVAPAPKLSRYYFSPLKAFEYMAAGRPVIAARIGQLAEIVRDGVTGLLVPPGDAEALATALKHLAQAPALRQAMGQAGRELALREYTWDSVWKRILQTVRPAINLDTVP